MATEHVDVLIVGAGLSGVAAAYYLQARLPHKSYAIVEARDAMGGTWDLFRYPGVRSDSDMHTLGFSFHPWHSDKVIAEAPDIRAYIHETAAAYGIDRNIRYSHRVRRACWSSAEARWTVDLAYGPADEPRQISCSFLWMCTGYYDYAAGYTPLWQGVDRFRGRIVHPQAWPDALDYADKRVLVIGSGATAVTLVPAMAERAAHVTMLQRSPTYILSRPTQEAGDARLRRRLPARFANWLVRWQHILLALVFYQIARRRPERVKRMIARLNREALGPDYDVATHLTPRYNPWDQRVCFAADGDFFEAIKSGKATIVTDEIDRFTETGVRTRSGEQLDADIIVTATGLNMRIMGGAQLVIDDQPLDTAKSVSYRGAMYSDVPNLAYSIGYTNSSWTLKCELIARYVCRLLAYMDRHHVAICVPRHPAVGEDAPSLIPLTSGYVQRVVANLPHQGLKRPWRIYQNYLLDVLNFRLSPIDDGTLEFAKAAKRVPHTAHADRSA